jgi:hypothetical protein
VKRTAIVTLIVIGGMAERLAVKKRSEPYTPGERGWVKVKHRHYWRFGEALGGRSAAGKRRTSFS